MFRLIIVLLFSFSLQAQESIFNENTSDKEDEVLKVRTRFPRYRVYYNHQKVVQEVQNEVAKSQEDTPSIQKETKSKSFFKNLSN